MSELPPLLDRIRRSTLRFAAAVRPHHLAAVAALVVAGIGVATVRAVALPEPRPVLDGERMQILVVAPVEPDIAPGSVMEVGDLVEGFEYRPLPRPVVEPVDWAPYDEDSVGMEPRRTPRRYDDQAVVVAAPQPDASPEGWRETPVGRWFGFDAPERDYRAEREARRARVDAQMERERERREVRWRRSDGEAGGDDARDGPRRQDEDPDDLRG